LKVLGRGTQAAARGAATLPQQEKNNSADVQSERKHYRLNMYSGKVNLACRSYAAALARVSSVFTPPAPAAKELGVGLRRPFRLHACGGILWAMARIVDTRLATPPNGPTTTFARGWSAFIILLFQITEFSI
jgi:hypothetical protein